MIYGKPSSLVEQTNEQSRATLLAIASTDPSKIVKMYLKEKKAREQAEILSETDEITKIMLNKRGWRSSIKKQGFHLIRHGEQFVMLFIDLDTLKKVNDTFGHHMGTKYIKLFAEVLVSTLRPEDTVSHPQGDEFFAMIPRIKKEEAEEYRETIVENFQKKLESLSKDEEFYRVAQTFPAIGPSIGIAHKVWSNEERKQLLEGTREETLMKVYGAMTDVLQVADQDLYRIKSLRKKTAQAKLRRLSKIKHLTQSFNILGKLSALRF